MALKKDGDRVKIALSIKRTTKDDLSALAEMGNRPLGRMLDILVYEEMQRVRKFTGAGDCEERLNAQKEYCKKRKKQMAAPEDGICWHCKNNIYSLITIDEASSKHTTSCPYCNRSFVD